MSLSYGDDDDDDDDGDDDDRNTCERLSLARPVSQRAQRTSRLSISSVWAEREARCPSLQLAAVPLVLSRR